MSPTAHDAALLEEWRQQVVAAFDECVGSASRVAFLQWPYDGNVGNHMMFVALESYLGLHKIPITYIAHHNNFDVDALRRAVGDGVVLFSGGVTLSKLWPGHPEIKRVVARELPTNRIVSLTSTMVFVDDDDELEASTIFGDHRDVVVMARDPVSAVNARSVLSPAVQIVTAPDSAFGLPTASRSGAPTVPILWLQRDDAESKGTTTPDDVETFDWSNDLRRIVPRAYVVLRFAGVMSHLRSSRLGRPLERWLNALILRCYTHVSRAVVGVGHRTLDRCTVLVTDRMHPHVLAALRGQHVVLLPDRFGKNRFVFDYLTSQLSTVHWADTPAAALAIARSIAAT